MILFDELIDLLKSKSSFLLLDVREPFEFENYGFIPTAKNIPLNKIKNGFLLNDELFKQSFGFSKLDKNIKIILYCRSGGRSLLATKILKKLGFNAYNYSGSILEWSKHSADVKAY
ncbi:MAG: rhodanese-like domain-containing protein [Candidatus Cloacimonetes bacterium]|nr:rhodanese-like domain-containing protein [Candidatus Cloacimonadota bacterium]MCF8012754.1 rhodanese-like domain-containing protein [Candidatus Woesearchaeota archaeon]